MIKLYLTEKESDLYKKTADILKSLGCGEILFDFSELKPKISAATPCPYHFNLSHSGNKAVIALSESSVGVDLELFTGKSRKSVLSRFSDREQREIINETDFLKHWTAREAFIKLNGKTLAEYFKRLEFFNGKIFFDGTEQSCNLYFYQTQYGIVAACGRDCGFEIINF